MRHALLLTALLAVPALAKPPAPKPAPVTWKDFDSEKFGFSMRVPETMTIDAGALGEWGGLHGQLDFINLWGLAKLDSFPKVEEMRQFVIAQSKIPAIAWKKIDSGKDVRGFTWFETWQAGNAKAVAYAIIGHGPKGAYALFLLTTPLSVAVSAKEYVAWYNSVQLR